MWLTWGALSLLVIDGLLQASGAVDFAPIVWVLSCLTLLLALAVDAKRRETQVERAAVPAQRRGSTASGSLAKHKA